MKKIISLAAFLLFTFFVHAQTLRWAGTMGGSSATTNIICMTSDLHGNIIAGGYYVGGSADLDPGPGTDIHSNSGGGNLFFTKFDTAGNYLWSVNFADSSGYMQLGALALDASGNIYLSGHVYYPVDFDPGPGNFYLTYGFFIAKYDSSGSFIWAQAMPGNGLVWDLKVDTVGNIVVAGEYWNTIDLDPGSGSQSFTPSGTSTNTFLAKYDLNGNYLWGGTIADLPNPYGSINRPSEVYLDANGNVYLTGYFELDCDFDIGPGNFVMSSPGNSLSGDAYLAKYDPSGAFQWAKKVGDESEETGTGIYVDQSCNVFWTAHNNSGTIDIDPSPAVNLQNVTEVMMELDSAGNTIWTEGIGVGAAEYVGLNGTLVDSNGNFCMMGRTAGTNAVDIDPGPGTFMIQANMAFVAYYSTLGNFLAAKELSPYYYNDYLLGPDDALYVCGMFQGTVDFDPDAQVNGFTAVGIYDAFAVKYNSSYNPLASTNSQRTTSVYPNPSNGTFTLDPGNLINGRVTVYDQWGKACYDTVVNGQQTLQLNSLPNGIYFLTLQSSTGSSTKSFVIIH